MPVSQTKYELKATPKWSFWKLDRLSIDWKVSVQYQTFSFTVTPSFADHVFGACW